MLTESGQVKIMDFGLAKVRGGAQVTKVGTTVGTAAYMSPEQARGDEVDHRTDIWSFGVVLYEMFAGRLPFRSDYEQAVTYSILNEEPEPISRLRTDAPVQLEQIVSKTMEKDQSKRYQHAVELLADLKASRSATETGIGPIQPSRSAPSKKKRTLVYGAFAGAAIVLIVGGIYLWQLLPLGSNDRAESPSEESLSPSDIKWLAVLPFDNLGSDPETDFLGYALADQIIGALAYVKNISVRPSSAIRKYQEKLVDAPTAGRDLKVDFVLAGNFLKEANVMRLNIELVDVHSNVMIWREPIEVPYENAFKLQDIVSEKVINGLKIQFSQDEKERIQSNVPRNPLAYEYFLRSISYPSTTGGDKLAIEMLSKSIQLDSTYAPAFSELGFRRQRYGNYGLGGEEEIKKAEQAYLKALSLNSDLVDGLWNLSILYTETARTEEAVELAKRILQINPNSAMAHFSLGYVYRYAGMLEESEHEYDKALSLDPGNPRFRSAGLTYRCLGKYEKAFQAYDLDKGSPFSVGNLGQMSFRKGQREQAIKYFDQLLAIEPHGAFGLLITAMKAIAMGKTEEGLRATREWEQTNPSDAEFWYGIAQLYGLLGDVTGCARALQKAILLGYFNYPFMQTDAFLGPVRAHPDFRRVLAMAKEKHETFKKRFFTN